MSEQKKKNKVTLIIYLIGIPLCVAVAYFASLQGEKSVTELNNYHGFSLVASENETDGSLKNRVEYYTYSDSFNPSVLEELCKKKMKLYKKNMDFNSYNMVVFSSSQYVVRSKYPIGAKYGDELDKLKYIKAFFIYKPYNNFTELSYYEKNAAESIGIRKNIQ